jgi:hypothetical protein
MRPDHTAPHPRASAPGTSAATSILPATGSPTPASTGSASDPGVPATVRHGKVAVVEWERGHPALYLQRTDGTARARVHFADVRDPLPDQSPDVPPVTDQNILAIGHLRWSPDGERLAVVVSVALDQSEVVVLDVVDAAGSARVASVNSQVVMTDVAWSADGRWLAYGMSTLAHAGAVEVFVTSVEQDAARQVTRGARIGRGARLRFVGGDRALLLSRVTGERGAPLFEQVSRVERVDVASGATRLVADALLGEVQGVDGDGDWALAIRRIGVLPDGEYDRRLVRVPLAGAGPERVLVDGGKLQYATLAAGPTPPAGTGAPADALALLAVDGAIGPTPEYTYDLVTAGEGAPRQLRLPAVDVRATAVDVWVPRDARS